LSNKTRSTLSALQLHIQRSIGEADDGSTDHDHFFFFLLFLFIFLFYVSSLIFFFF